MGYTGTMEVEGPASTDAKSNPNSTSNSNDIGDNNSGGNELVVIDESSADQFSPLEENIDNVDAGDSDNEVGVTITRSGE